MNSKKSTLRHIFLKASNERALKSKNVKTVLRTVRQYELTFQELLPKKICDPTVPQVSYFLFWSWNKTKNFVRKRIFGFLPTFWKNEVVDQAFWKKPWKSLFLWLNWDSRAYKQLQLFYGFSSESWSTISFFQNVGRNPKIRFLTKFYFCFNSKMCKYETWGTLWPHIFSAMILVKIGQNQTILEISACIGA